MTLRLFSFVSALVFLAVASCGAPPRSSDGGGGSSSGGGGGGGSPPCLVSGTWSIDDSIAYNTDGTCSDFSGEQTQTVQISVGASPDAIVWTTDGGSPLNGTLNANACTADLVVPITFPVTDNTGATIFTETLEFTRHLAFSGNTLTGVETVSDSTYPQQPGTPCSVSGTTTGTRTN